MSRIRILVLAAALLASTPLATRAQTAAHTAGIPDEAQDRPIPSQKLSGPRFGFTAFTGDVADGRRLLGKSAAMTQFGWQFETRLLSTSTGHQALMEWVVLVGGVEQSEFNASLSWLAGFRMPNGLEFGVGPNLSRSSETGNRTTSMVTAVGMTPALGEIHLPLNLAVAFAEGGPRITLLAGWIVG